MIRFSRSSPPQSPSRFPGRTSRISRILHRGLPALGLLALAAHPALAADVDPGSRVGGGDLSVVIRGENAFVGHGAFLRILDVSDPTTPTQVSEYPLSGVANDVVVQGNLAFVSAEDDGLVILDVADPAQPSRLGSFSSPAASECQVVGVLAYVADTEVGLRIVDVSTPAAPVLVGEALLENGAFDVAVQGTVAYVADGAWGVRVFDVTTPAAPVQIGFHPTGDGQDGDDFVVGITPHGTLLLLAAYDEGVEIVDVTDPTRPVPVGSFATPNDVNAVLPVVNVAFAAGSESGVHALDISDPSAPTLLSTFDTPGYAYELANAGPFLFVADYEGGLVVLNAGDPAAMFPVSRIDTIGYSFDVAVHIDEALSAGVAPDPPYAVAADFESGIHVLDTIDPWNPRTIGTLDTPGSAVGVAADHESIVIADLAGGLHVASVVDRTSPTMRGSFATAGPAIAVTLADPSASFAGKAAYVSEGLSGFEIVDVTVATAPARVGAFDTPGETLEIAVSGDFAYVADGTAGLHTMDVSDPTSPTLIRTLALEGDAHAVALMGSFAYVAAGDQGLVVADLSDPTSPTMVGVLDTPGHAMDVLVRGSLQTGRRGAVAVVADGPAGYHVVDIDSPAHPRLHASIDPPGVAEAVAMFRNHVIGSQQVGGLQTFDVGPTLLNLSTRGYVGVDSDVMIGGIIVGGSEPRRVLVSGIGPDLANFGIADPLRDPTLAIVQGSNVIASSDDWMDSPDADAIRATGLAPNDPLESAVILELDPGEYTAILAGDPSTSGTITGTGLVQAFDLGVVSGGRGQSRPSNLSTRMRVGTGERVGIGGFIISGAAPKQVLVRGLGPTIGAPPFDVPGALANPALTLFSGQDEIAFNDDWQAAENATAILATGLAPANAAEPAILIELSPGAYTAALFGAEGTEGVALVEIYELDGPPIQPPSSAGAATGSSSGGTSSGGEGRGGKAGRRGR